MEFEEGTVISKDSEHVVIEMEAGQHCVSCSAKENCCSLGNESLRHIKIPIENEINIGDRVTLGYKPKSRIISAFLVFIFPLLMLIVGYFIGYQLFNTENRAILTAFTALSVGFVLIWILSKILDRHKSFIPTIIKIN